MPIEVVTVGRHGSSMASVRGRLSFPIWAAKLYRAVPRKKDGVYTWRLIDSGVGGLSRSGRVPSGKFIREVQEWARDNGYQFVENVVHGQRSRVGALELLGSVLDEERSAR